MAKRFCVIVFWKKLGACRTWKSDSLLSSAAIKAARQCFAIQVSANEEEAALGRSAVPRSPCRRVQNHVDSLENHASRISLDGKNALHAKNVLALGAKEFGKPFVEFLSVAVAIAFDADAGDSVVMMMAMILVFFFEEVRVDFHRVIEVKAADIEHFGKFDPRVGGAVNLGHGINAAEAFFKCVDFCG